MVTSWQGTTGGSSTPFPRGWLPAPTLNCPPLPSSSSRMYPSTCTVDRGGCFQDSVALLLWVQHSSSCRMGGAGTGEETNHQLVQLVQPWLRATRRGGCRGHLLPRWVGSSRGRGGSRKDCSLTKLHQIPPPLQPGEAFLLYSHFLINFGALWQHNAPVLSCLDLSCSQFQTWDVLPQALQNAGSGLTYSPAFPSNKFTTTKLGG